MPREWANFLQGRAINNPSVFFPHKEAEENVIFGQTVRNIVDKKNELYFWVGFESILKSSKKSLL